jgi:hypothetical protein
MERPDVNVTFSWNFFTCLFPAGITCHFYYTNLASQNGNSVLTEHVAE